MMDLYTLLEKLGLEVSEIRSAFAENNSRFLFAKFPDVIRYLIFIESEYEFSDFLEQSSLNAESFLLAYAYLKGACDSYVINDDAAGKALCDRHPGALSDEEIERINKDATNLVAFYKKLNESSDCNNLNDSSDQRFAVLFDDRYDEGTYYVFEISKEIFDEKWNLQTVKREV